MNIIPEEEILNRLRYAGKKKSKQLLAKLIKRYGGKPILHIKQAKFEESEDFSMNWSCFTRSIYGFTWHEDHVYSKILNKEIKSISGNMPEDIIEEIISIERYK